MSRAAVDVASQLQIDDLASRWVEAERRPDVNTQHRDASGQFRVTLVAVPSHDQWRVAGLHVRAIAQPPGAPGV